VRAVVMTRFGGPEVLEVRDEPRPMQGPRELLVKVIASSANPVEAKLRQDGTWAKVMPPAVIGYDAAGIVEAIGPGVTDYVPGDAVYYTPEVLGNYHGTHAEYNVVAADIVAPKPRSLRFAEAAAVPLAGGTAYEGIVRRLAVRLGETVLIHGGAGGVGSFAVQLAKHAGARVLATASAANQQTLRELGADVAIDYAREDAVDVALRETNGRGVDAVFDTVGGELMARSIAATRAFGRLATILPPQGDFRRLHARNQTVHGIFLTRERRRLDALGRLIDRGQVRPVIDAVWSLAQIQDAHRRLDRGHGRGKVVLQVSAE
jgi:NADPH2:quinone reductase